MKIPMTITYDMLRYAILDYLVKQGLAQEGHEVGQIEVHRKKGGGLDHVTVNVDTEPT